MDTAVRRKAIGRGVLLGVVVTAIVVVGCSCSRVGMAATSHRRWERSRPRRASTASPPLPAEFERFDGTKGTFADYRGTPLVVNFFASWCTPCVREMPDLQQVHSELGSKVAFLGINNQDRAADGQMIRGQGRRHLRPRP